MNALYPLALEPQEHETIWGGDALVTSYGKHAPAHAKVGESWECWDENRIANGEFAGATVADVRLRLGHDFVGRGDPKAIFPLLTKLIDARAPLSVQVHPNDAYAQRVEGQNVGKTESWFILEAEPDATIVLGWNRDTSRGEYLERVRDGSLGELLRHVPVHPGDVFHLPAGTLHAIGAGIVLFEAQQASDLTYRIFDYNRLGPDGTPRTLHVEKAADVLDYHRSTAGRLRHLTYELDGLERTALIADPKFWMERIALSAQAHGLDTEGMPLVILALDKPLEVEARGAQVRLAPYESAIVPAALDVAMVRGLEPGATLLAAAPPAGAEALPKRFARAAVDVGASTSFLAQF